MESSGMTDLAKYGAFGTGAAVLAYTAALLKQELSKPTPRRAARDLILTFMAFSLVAFCIAAFIELREKAMLQNSDATALASRIAVIASSLDSNVGGKFQATVRSLPDESPEKKNLVYFTNVLCSDVKDLKTAIGENAANTFCSTH
jgi:hypothetical protein